MHVGKANLRKDKKVQFHIYHIGKESVTRGKKDFQINE